MNALTKAILEQMVDLGYRIRIMPVEEGVEIRAVNDQTGEEHVAHCDDDEEEKYQAVCALADAAGIEFEDA
jgi:hypothetical protein